MKEGSVVVVCVEGVHVSHSVPKVKRLMPRGDH